jgi:TfoX/Sxy family transcriptional regulator of competence genes
MATSAEFIEYVCGQIEGTGAVRSRKMFGEYMVYVNDKPVLLVCDNTVFVKMLEGVAEKMTESDRGIPYSGAKEHYILDIEDAAYSREIVAILEKLTPVPAPKKKKAKKTAGSRKLP